MKEYVLTGDELLYLAAKEGADEIEGVADDISMLNGSSLMNKLSDIEDSLDEKGYQEVDFDGNCILDDELADLVDTLVNSEGKILVNHRPVGKSEIGIVYYIKSGKICQIEEVDEENFRLKAVTVETLKSKLPYDLIESENTNTDYYRIRESHIQKAAALYRNGSEDKGIEELTEAGLDRRIASVVMNALSGRSDMYVTLFDFETEEEAEFRSLVLIKDNLVLRLENDVSEDNETLQVFSYVGRDDVTMALNYGLELFGLN